MSERLTTRLANGGVGYDNGEYFKVCYPWNEHCLTDIDRMAIKLCDLEDKIEQGKIVELPCKIGQTVYMPWEWNGIKAVAILEVTRIVDDFTERSPYVNTNFLSDDEDYWVAYNCGRFEFKDFGKTVFLTREEAEKALAERGYKK